MFSDLMTGPGSWPEPLLGVGLDRLGHTPSHAPKIRLSRSSKIFLAIVVTQSILIAFVRLLTDIIWKLPATASHGLLNTEQNSWFFICFIISACYNVLFALDAVINESRPALFACIGSSLLLTFRSVVEFSYKESACSKESLNWICIPGLIEVVCYQIFLVSLGLGSVITQMGFRFYRIVGADLSLREIYERYIQWVTMYRLNQQFSLLAFITALFFSNSVLQVIFTVSFLVLEAAWEMITVLAIHKEDPRLSRLAVILSSCTPAYSAILLVLLAGNPFFFDGLMLFKIFFLVILNIINRVIVEILAHRLRACFGQGFRSRILPKLNLLSLALPIRCLSESATWYPATIDLQLDSRASSNNSSAGSSPSAADL